MKQNNHFHSTEKGCKIVIKRFTLPRTHQQTGSRGYLLGKHCLTHEKDLCKCGYEWFWHGGTDSRKLKK